MAPPGAFAGCICRAHLPDAFAGCICRMHLSDVFVGVGTEVCPGRLQEPIAVASERADDGAGWVAGTAIVRNLLLGGFGFVIYKSASVACRELRSLMIASKFSSAQPMSETRWGMSDSPRGVRAYSTRGGTSG